MSTLNELQLIIKNLGPVTAYGDAVAGGYSGTREQFREDLANLGENVAQVSADAKAAKAAQTAAEEAKAAAEGAQTAAEQASSTAESAKTDAETAKKDAEAARDEAGTAKTAAETAKAGAESAKAAAEKAKADAEAAKSDAENAKTNAEAAQSAAETAADAASDSATAASQSASTAAASEANAATSETNAAAAAKEAEDLRDGIAKEIDDTKDAVLAEIESAGEEKMKEISAVGAVRYDAVQELTEEQKAQARENIGVTSGSTAAQSPRYGVSGVGGSLTTLSRLIFDGVNRTAAVGTDTETPTNDFDDLAPFNRRKCVGTWSQPDENGKAHFTVNAYEGDPDYTEDGSMGDYVAVEVKPFWYYQDLEAGIIMVSPGKQTDPGWAIHPVCVNDDGEIRENTYLPAYNLAFDEDGHAVSLPGYHPTFGSYKALRDAARTYGGGNTAAQLEPMAVRHYEWLLFTIEYATTNGQSVMQGASSMRYTSDKVSADGEDVNFVVVTAAIGNNFVVGQSIYIGPTYSTTPANADTGAYNVITAIETCDIDGSPNESGEYRKITFDGNPRTVTAGTTAISSRPWKTGSCGSVKTPSGSPVSNTDAKHPMRYRWRENIWGNIYSTCNNLFVTKEGTGEEEDPYYAQWYYLVDPAYYPSATSKPDKNDLTTESFVVLSPKTEWKSGYIQAMEADEERPHCIVPVTQTGGSATTYYSDYLYLSATTAAVRLGGDLCDGANDGPLSFGANGAPSFSYWSYGGGLYFNQ